MIIIGITNRILRNKEQPDMKIKFYPCFKMGLSMLTYRTSAASKLYGSVTNKLLSKMEVSKQTTFAAFRTVYSPTRTQLRVVGLE